VRGYALPRLYEQTAGKLHEARPGQDVAIRGQFGEPFTGAPPPGAAMTTGQRAEAPLVPD